MTSRTIQTTTGNQILYKVIKDGYKTVTQTINVTDILPTRTSYDLVPSSIVHGNELNYTIDTNHDYPPIITFNPNVETADGEEITTSKYVFAPYGKEYVIVDDNEKDNFTTIGNVKVNSEGVASNFAIGSGAILTPNIPFSTNDYEMVIGFKINSWLSDYQCFFHSTSNCYFNIAVTSQINGNYYIHSNTGNGSNWYTDITGTTPLELNKNYLVKITRVSGIRHMYLSDDDGATWSEEGSLADTYSYSITYYIGRASGSNLFSGSINLSKSYINVNSEFSWIPTWNKIVSNYSVIGLLEMKEGITQQAFTSANYVNSIPQSFTQVSPTASNWEWVFKIEQYATSSSRQVLYSQGRSYESSLYIDTNNKIGLSINNTANSTYVVSMAGSTILVSGNSYWIKARFTGSSYQLLLSTDGKTWRSEASTSSTTKLAATSNENWHIGYNYHSNSTYHYLLKSKLNLRESYIKVNGEYWWRGIKIDSNTIIPGILDVNYFDTGDEVTLKLYDVETNNRTLIINDTRNVDVSDKKFVQYDGDILIPEHGLSVYDEDNYTWSKYRIITLNVNDESTSIYTEGDIE